MAVCYAVMQLFLTSNVQLHALILSAASAPIQNEPTEQQKARVRSLERADNARRRAQKDKRSQTKRGRASGKEGDW